MNRIISKYRNTNVPGNYSWGDVQPDREISPAEEAVIYTIKSFVGAVVIAVIYAGLIALLYGAYAPGAVN